MEGEDVGVPCDQNDTMKGSFEWEDGFGIDVLCL